MTSSGSFLPRDAYISISAPYATMRCPSVWPWTSRRKSWNVVFSVLRSFDYLNSRPADWLLWRRHRESRAQREPVVVVRRATVRLLSVNGWTSFPRYSASNNSMTMKSWLGIIQIHWRWRCSTDHVQLIGPIVCLPL